MIDFFHDTIFVPIYNLLVFIVDHIPGGDIGLAIVLATLVVKVLIAPIAFSALKTQRAMKELEPELKALREKYKDDKETQAKELFALYKARGVKPFSSILLMFIQIPILISLYLVFFTKPITSVEAVDTSILYSFVPVPEVITPLFLGFVSIAGPSIVLALLAAATQFLQARYAMPVPQKPEKGAAPSMQEEFGRAMALQVRYVLPLVIGFVAYASGAVALYFITSNLVSIVQEYIIRKKYPRPVEG